jgi:glutamyl-tRNA synthetase
MDLTAFEKRYPPRPGLPTSAEVSRVAPSPTGRPHIGTALQGVIDRAIASQSSGVFLLRIEDTDRKRLVPGAVDEIIAALRWLGIAPDEGPELGGAYGPYVQSERLPLYQSAAGWLLAHGHAYRCFCTSARLDEVRRTQQAAGLPPRYDRHCRLIAPDDVERQLAAGKPFVVRLAVPDDRQIRFHDEQRGDIIIDSNLVDDQVLLKSDGFPTYHLAVVVDDHFMHVTTAVRGEEWISSTPKHILLYDAFGWQMPRIIHTPLLRDADRRKLSKSTGDTSIGWFRMQGYLPDGLRNFLTRLIWTHPDEKDIYPWLEFVERFSLSALRATAPVADTDLLDFINGQYIRMLAPEALYQATCEWLQHVHAEAYQSQAQAVTFELSGKGEFSVSASVEDLQLFAAAFTRDPAYTQRVLTLEPERYKKLCDMLVQTRLFFPDLFTAARRDQLVKPLGDPAQARAVLAAYGDGAEAGESHEQWERRVRTLAEQVGAKVGKLFMTLRIALTSSEQTPPLYDIIGVIGEDEARRRIELALRTLGT